MVENHRKCDSTGQSFYLQQHLVNDIFVDRFFLSS